MLIDLNGNNSFVINKNLDLIYRKAKKIKLLLTDCDGVLTDAGIYYSKNGEEFKRFSFRDGMGVERLREIVNVETGIITGENSQIVKRRAEKLKIDMLFSGVKDKFDVLTEIVNNKGIDFSEVAYIGDDYNDLEVMESVGLSACPNDSLPAVRNIANYICSVSGGCGAFREFAELIIMSKVKNTKEIAFWTHPVHKIDNTILI